VSGFAAGRGERSRRERQDGEEDHSLLHNKPADRSVEIYIKTDCRCQRKPALRV
jgi:hypothetical protein